MAIRNSIKNKELFSSRLKELRKESNLTLKQLGKLTGLSEQAISHYENGIRLPKFEIISELAATLEVSVDYLSGNSDKKYSDYIFPDRYALDEILDSVEDLDNKTINENIGFILDSLYGTIKFSSTEDIIILSKYLRLFLEYVKDSYVKQNNLDPIQGTEIIKDNNTIKHFLKLIDSIKKLDYQKRKVSEFNGTLFEQTDLENE